MKKSKSGSTEGKGGDSPPQLIDARIKELGDWRGETLARVRRLIKQVDPDVVETWKWRGVPVWEHSGIICTGETYKAVVKLTFAKGASLEDPSGLFNSSLEGNVRRAMDFREGDKIDEEALKALIRAAVALNTSKRETARLVRSRKSPDIQPLTPDRWDDLVDLFGLERGANSGCWCMWPRMPGKDFKAMPREARREAFRRIVEAGPPPGLLAYDEGIPIGWVAVGPRPTLARFNAGKTSRPVEGEDEPDPARIHAISCFYIRAGHRKRGLMGRLAEAAVAFAKRSGAAAVEVCAIESEKRLQWGEGYVGIASVFRPLGFAEVARRSPRRPLMRRILR